MRLTFFTDCGLRKLMRMAQESGRAFSTAALADIALVPTIVPAPVFLPHDRRREPPGIRSR